MRKVTMEIYKAFYLGIARSVGNTSTDGNAIYLHGNKIVERRNEREIWVSNAGWATVTTKDRLNAIAGVSINQKRGQWYLNNEAWDGSWTKVVG